MTKITNEMVEYVYQVASKVYRDEIEQAEGKYDVVKVTGMGAGSAANYITVFMNMMGGTCYTRTINKYATEYFLEHIGNDYGGEAQRKAAQATVKHVHYYKSRNGYLATADKLAHQYL